MKSALEVIHAREEELAEITVTAKKLGKQLTGLHKTYAQLDKSYAQQISEFSKLADKHEVQSNDIHALRMEYHRIESQHKKLDANLRAPKTSLYTRVQYHKRYTCHCP